MVSAGLITPDSATPQPCPLCAYFEVDTLTPERTRAIEGWGPACTTLADAAKARAEPRLRNANRYDDARAGGCCETTRPLLCRLDVPQPRGKGYKVELELKANVSSDERTAEVDALRVFVSLQVDAGRHRRLRDPRSKAGASGVFVFDDPVQSMDDEHLQTLAGRLVAELLDQGFQVLIFTHSARFDRALDYSHYSRPSYLTLETHPSKRKGCWVEEGNRRIADRLKSVERCADDGRLTEGWRLLRFAIDEPYIL